jgi:hypothetical protein
VRSSAPRPCGEMSETKLLFTKPNAIVETADAKILGTDVVRFDVSTTFRGSSSFFEVYFDDDLGTQAGNSISDGVLARCDIDYAAIADIFGSGTVPPLPMKCIICTYNHASGGYHYGCIDTTLYVSGQTLAPPRSDDVATALAVLVAEEVEVFSAAQGIGWNCGDTNGEGLSRVLAEELYPGVLDYFHTANIWLDGGRPDYVTTNIGNDRDQHSNGCSVVFLYFLHYILGYDWATIVQAGGTTLENTYRNLVGSGGGYTALRECVDALYPPGVQSGLTDDNPFPVLDYYAAAATLV